LNVRWAITSRFNDSRAYGPHEGIDLDDATRTGDSKAHVLATNSGRIKSVLRHSGGYGLHIVLEGLHKTELFTITYGHLDNVYVSAGQFIEVGTPLGEIGLTGNVTGEHLHITLQAHGWGLDGYVREDVIDPEPYLPNPNDAGKPSIPDLGEQYDLLAYFLGNEGNQYMVKTYAGPKAGSQERFRIEHHPAEKLFYIVKNQQWELYHYDDNLIYQDTDTSPGHGEYYKVRDVKGGSGLVKRCPRFMRVNEYWQNDVSHYVEIFDKQTGLNSGSIHEGTATNSAFFRKAGAFTAPDGTVYPDSITVQMGTEDQTLIMGKGSGGWIMEDKLSAITKEDVNGQQPMEREEIQ
jgi:hypothetical protein